MFQAKPDSVLNKTDNGDWALAKDDKGRACINSDPAHWPLIMRWLSLGAVPSLTLCTSDFIAECKYWQLDNLLAARRLCAARQKQQFSSIMNVNTNEHSFKVVQYTDNGQDGFEMQARIHSFVERFRSKLVVEIRFAACGASWKLEVGHKGVFIQPEAHDHGGPQSEGCSFLDYNWSRLRHMAPL